MSGEFQPSKSETSFNTHKNDTYIYAIIFVVTVTLFVSSDTSLKYNRTVVLETTLSKDMSQVLNIEISNPIYHRCLCPHTYNVKAVANQSLKINSRSGYELGSLTCSLEPKVIYKLWLLEVSQIFIIKNIFLIPKNQSLVPEIFF